MATSIRHQPVKKTAATIIVLGCLAAQASTAVTGTKVWPFMAYCMYSESNPAPVTSRQRHVVAIFDDDSTKTIVPLSVGVSSFIWERHYIHAMTSGEPDALHNTAERIERYTDRRVVRIELHTDVHQIIDGSHVIQKETTILGELPPQTEMP
jgi:hypothetical protein